MIALVAFMSSVASPAAAQQAQDSAARRAQRSLDSLTAAMRELQARVDSMARATPQTASAPAQQAAPSGSYMNLSFDGLGHAGWSSVPDVGTIQRGGHDPKVRGFTVPQAELALDGTVDPYLKGFSNIVFFIDENGETQVELEEMYLLTTSLPKNLQIKAGQFFTEFGRQNQQHPHGWAFADQPLVLNRMFGADGMRSQGARLSWLLPLPFYVEAMFTAANSVGETMRSFRNEESSEIHGGIPVEREVKNASDLTYTPRIAASFDPTDNQTLLFGVSGSFGPNNSGATGKTSIGGADVYWKWKSPTARQGFPFVSLQSEVLFRSYDADERTSASTEGGILPAQTLKDNGWYAQLLWGIKPMLIAGLRGEAASGDEDIYASQPPGNRSRISPNITWHPSEYSRLRLQYNYGRRPGYKDDHSVWLQYEFLIGSHSAHKF